MENKISKFRLENIATAWCSAGSNAVKRIVMSAEDRAAYAAALRQMAEALEQRGRELSQTASV